MASTATIRIIQDNQLYVTFHVQCDGLYWVLGKEIAEKLIEIQNNQDIERVREVVKILTLHFLQKDTIDIVLNGVYNSGDDIYDIILNDCEVYNYTLSIKYNNKFMNLKEFHQYVTSNT